MIPGAGSAVLERRLKIADWIRRHGIMRVEALSEALGVSVVTVRADLSYLEAQGMVIRGVGHAKAVPNGDTHAMREPRVPAGLQPMLQETRRLLAHQQTILLGPGAAVMRLVPLLADIPDLNLILTSLETVPVAQACLDATLHLIGGQITGKGSLSGPQTVQALTLHQIDAFVVQAKAAGPDAMLLSPADNEVFSVAAARRAARTIALVMGTTAMSAGGLSRLPLTHLDDAVFPASPDAETRKTMESAGFRGAMTETGCTRYSRPHHSGDAAISRPP